MKLSILVFSLLLAAPVAQADDDFASRDVASQPVLSSLPPVAASSEHCLDGLCAEGFNNFTADRVNVTIEDLGHKN
ncbi:MAG: hypothetical protein ACXVB9_13545 [Bdellovibrionota bacterium]